MMSQSAEFMFAIGSILLLGLASDYLGRRTFLPRVSVLLILGILIGDEVLGLVPQSLTARFGVITDLALLMIGFLLGGRLTLKSLQPDGNKVLWISFAAAAGAMLIVLAALVVLGMPLGLAILLGCIAAATDAVATYDAVVESNPEHPFARLLLAIVAIDDVWALLLFSLGLAFVSVLTATGSLVEPLLGAGYEIFGALLLGALIGLPAAVLTGRLKPGQPMLTEALGLVFVCGGAAFWLDVSFLIASMSMGAVIANLAKHHDYPFHEIENIEWPFLAIFFVLAGASLNICMLPQVGLTGLVYLLARMAGKYTGARIGAHVSYANSGTGSLTGLSLMPQAGIAIGMALLTAEQYPEYGQMILSIVVSTTIFFEIVGPAMTRFALKRAAFEKVGE